MASSSPGRQVRDDDRIQDSDDDDELELDSNDDSDFTGDDSDFTGDDSNDEDDGTTTDSDMSFHERMARRDRRNRLQRPRVYPVSEEYLRATKKGYVKYARDFQDWINGVTGGPHCAVMPIADPKKPKIPAKRHAVTADSLRDPEGRPLETYYPRRKELNLCQKNLGFLCLLGRPVIVVDIDDPKWVDAIVEFCPGFKETVSCSTSKGAHFYFLRTERAKDIVDRARGIRDIHRAERDYGLAPAAGSNAVPIDVKTVHATGTRGCIALPPFGGKVWTRHPWFGPQDSDESSSSQILPIPDEFVDFLEDRSYTRPAQVKVTSSAPFGTSKTLQDIEPLLSLLSHQRIHEYSTWIELGIAIHSVDDSDVGLNAWKAVSSRSDKYDEIQCIWKWTTFRRRVQGGLTAGSLYRWAELDNPRGYADFMKTPQVVKRDESSEALEWHAMDARADPMAMSLSSNRTLQQALLGGSIISAVAQTRLLSLIRSVKYAVVRSSGSNAEHMEATLRLDAENVRKALAESNRGCPTCALATLDDDHWPRNSHQGPRLRVKLSNGGGFFLDYLCSSETCLDQPKPLVTRLLGNPPATASTSIPLSQVEATSIAEALQWQCNSVLANPDVQEMWLTTASKPEATGPSFIEDGDTGERTLLGRPGEPEMDMVASLASEAEILKNMLETEMKAAASIEATQTCRQEVRDVYDRVCSLGIQEVAGDGISAFFESDSIQHRVFPVTTSCYTRPAVARSSAPSSSSARQSKRNITRDQWDHADDGGDIEYPGPLVPNLVLRGRLSDVLGAYDKNLTSAYTEWRIEQNSHGDLTLTGTGKNTRQKEYVIEVDNYVKDGGTAIRFNATAPDYRVIRLARTPGKDKRSLTADGRAKEAIGALNAWMSTRSPVALQGLGLQQLVDCITAAVRSGTSGNNNSLVINIGGSSVNNVSVGGDGNMAMVQLPGLTLPVRGSLVVEIAESIVIPLLKGSLLQRLVGFWSNDGQNRNGWSSVYYCRPPVHTPIIELPEDDYMSAEGVWEEIQGSKAGLIMLKQCLAKKPDIDKHVKQFMLQHAAEILYFAMVSVEEYPIEVIEQRQELANKLDASSRLLPVQNGLMDFGLLGEALVDDLFSRATTMFRAVRYDDYVTRKGCASWNWSEEAARQHLPDVDRFLEQVFPVREERQRFLRFVASTFNASRTAKKVMVLVDAQEVDEEGQNRAGNNSKTTLWLLQSALLGNHAVCLQGADIFQGSGSSDANKPKPTDEIAAKSRLLVAEEMGLGVSAQSQHRTVLNGGKIKLWSGGGKGATIEGRRLWTNTPYRVTFNGGIVLVFNLTSVPMMHVEPALAERFMALPMRATFVKEDALVNEKLYRFKVDESVKERVADWAPAFFIRVLEEYRVDGIYDLSDTPEMAGFKKEILVRASRPLGRPGAPAAAQDVEVPLDTILTDFFGPEGGAEKVPVERRATHKNSVPTGVFKAKLEEWWRWRSSDMEFRAPVHKLAELMRTIMGFDKAKAVIFPPGMVLLDGSMADHSEYCWVGVRIVNWRARSRARLQAEEDGAEETASGTDTESEPGVAIGDQL